MLPYVMLMLALVFILYRMLILRPKSISLWSLDLTQHQQHRPLDCSMAMKTKLLHFYLVVKHFIFLNYKPFIWEPELSCSIKQASMDVSCQGMFIFENSDQKGCQWQENEGHLPSQHCDFNILHHELLILFDWKHKRLQLCCWSLLQYFVFRNCIVLLPNAHASVFCRSFIE